MYKQTNNYGLICFSTGQFQCQIICLSYESIYSYIHLLEKELTKRNIMCADILIDQLLITGNNKNRFLSIKFSSGKFILSTATNINADTIYRQFTMDYLKSRTNILRNSVLSPKQITMIEHGCVL